MSGTGRAVMVLEALIIAFLIAEHFQPVLNIPGEVAKRLLSTEGKMNNNQCAFVRDEFQSRYSTKDEKRAHE